jgi:hypothetical protein
MSTTTSYLLTPTNHKLLPKVEVEFAAGRQMRRCEWEEVRGLWWATFSGNGFSNALLTILTYLLLGVLLRKNHTLTHKYFMGTHYKRT